jgi:hypothetical protein
MGVEERSREIELKMLEAEVDYRQDLYEAARKSEPNVQDFVDARNRLDERVDEIIAEEDDG